MQMNAKRLLSVIFVLSTIVTLTDCCSSRILRLKEHTLIHIRHDAQQQQTEVVKTEPLSQNYVEVAKNHSNADITASYQFVASNTSITSTSHTPPAEALLVQASLRAQPAKKLVFNATEHAPPDRSRSRTTTATIDYVDYVPAENSTAASFVTDYVDEVDVDAVDVTDEQPGADSSVREQHAGSAKYHVLDLYYYIMRDVLSYECTGQYLTDFCLNGGRCFRYPVGNHSFFSCECADGYIGERCESKSLSDLPVTPAALKSTRRPSKVRMAHIFFSFPMLIFLSVIYLLLGALIVFRCPKRGRAAGLLED